MKISKEEELKIVEEYLKIFKELLANNIIRLKWITKEEAKKVLGTKSPTKLQNLRDNNEIVYSQHGKIIMYDINSLEDFLERNSNRKRINK